MSDNQIFAWLVMPCIFVLSGCLVFVGARDSRPRPKKLAEQPDPSELRRGPKGRVKEPGL
jgi:hypothetical protein